MHRVFRCAFTYRDVVGDFTIEAEATSGIISRRLLRINFIPPVNKGFSINLLVTCCL